MEGEHLRLLNYRFLPLDEVTVKERAVNETTQESHSQLTYSSFLMPLFLCNTLVNRVTQEPHQCRSLRGSRHLWLSEFSKLAEKETMLAVLRVGPRSRQQRSG